MRWHVAQGAGEQGELLVEALNQLGDGQDLESGSGELDGERDPVQPSADLGDQRSVLGIELESWHHQARPIDEQGDRIGGLDLLDRADAGAGDGQGADVHQLLVPNRQQLPARRQDPELGCVLEQVVGQFRHRVD